MIVNADTNSFTFLVDNQLRVIASGEDGNRLAGAQLRRHEPAVDLLRDLEYSTPIRSWKGPSPVPTNLCFCPCGFTSVCGQLKDVDLRISAGFMAATQLSKSGL